jgi:hypothetical protein
MSAYKLVPGGDVDFLDAVKKVAERSPQVATAPSGRRVVVAVRTIPRGRSVVALWLEIITTASDVATVWRHRKTATGWERDGGRVYCTRERFDAWVATLPAVA